MKLYTLLLVGSGTVLLLGVGCRSEKISTPLPIASSINSSSTSSSVFLDGDGLMRNTSTIKLFDEESISASSSAYDFEATYPITRNPKIDQTIDRYIQKALHNMQTAARENPPWETRNDFDWSYNLEMGYEVTASSSDLISMVFYGEEFDGGVHPSHFVDSFTFDRRTGKMLGLPDIFKPGSTYLKKLSEFSTHDLIENQEFPKDEVVEGASPKKDNFGVFSLSNTGMIIYFGNYQVGPYVMGMPTVSIPLEEIQDFLRPDMVKKITSLVPSSVDSQ